MIIILVGIPGSFVPTPLPSVSSEVVVVKKKPVTPIVNPIPTVSDTKSSVEVTISPTIASKEYSIPVPELEEKPTHYPIEKETFFEQGKRVPLIKTIGEETVLKCDIPKSLIKNTVEWEKIGGKLPENHQVKDDMLIIKKIQKDDGGLYQCSVFDEKRIPTVSFVDLKIADYVPVFHGNAVINLPPLSDQQWSNLDLELSIKPVTRDG